MSEVVACAVLVFLCIMAAVVSVVLVAAIRVILSPICQRNDCADGGHNLRQRAQKPDGGNSQPDDF